MENPIGKDMRIGQEETEKSKAFLLAFMLLAVGGLQVAAKDTDCGGQSSLAGGAQLRYVPCPVGPGQCHKNDFLRKYPYEDRTGTYVITEYGCGMCGGVDHVVKDRVM